MKKSLLIALLLLSSSTMSYARDTLLNLAVKDVMSRADVQQKLGKDVKFFFGKSKHPAVKSKMGEFSTNKKTNAFNKSDQEACQWAMFSALLALKQRATSIGANAVVNIRSNYKGNIFNSDTEYQCGAGTLIAGTALIGDFVKI